MEWRKFLTCTVFITLRFETFIPRKRLHQTDTSVGLLFIFRHPCSGVVCRMLTVKILDLDSLFLICSWCTLQKYTLTFVLYLGVKRHLSNFVNHKKIPVWHKALPFRDFSLEWSGYTIKQPGRQSAHCKVLGTCGLLKLATFYGHVPHPLTFDLEGHWS